jgi:hypothetical protein
MTNLDEVKELINELKIQLNKLEEDIDNITIEEAGEIYNKLYKKEIFSIVYNIDQLLPIDK